MDEHLKLLADTALHATAAEEHLAEGASTAARDALEAGDAGLSQLRARWPGMAEGERVVVGRAATSVRQRLDAVRTRLPVRSALSEGTPEHDEEQEIDPAAVP